MSPGGGRKELFPEPGTGLPGLLTASGSSSRAKLQHLSLLEMQGEASLLSLRHLWQELMLEVLQRAAAASYHHAHTATAFAGESNRLSAPFVRTSLALRNLPPHCGPGCASLKTWLHGLLQKQPHQAQQKHSYHTRPRGGLPWQHGAELCRNTPPCKQPPVSYVAETTNTTIAVRARTLHQHHAEVFALHCTSCEARCAVF